jgi:hypothetical protein
VIILKFLMATVIFLGALALFLFGPQHGQEPLMVAGLDLDSRTATALSIIGMVFGVILALRTFAEQRFASSDRAKYPS